MKLKILTIFGIIMMLGLVSGLSDKVGGTLIGKQGDTISLPQECTTCSYVYITSVQYPNLSRTYLNTSMNKQGYSYDYTWTETTELGDYIYCGYGDIDGTDTAFCNDFLITPDGLAKNENIIWYLILAVAVGIFLYISTSKLLGGVIVLVTGVGIMFAEQSYGWVGVIIMITGIGLLVELITSTPKRGRRRYRR